MNDREIDIDRLAELLPLDGNGSLIDVREPSEYVEVHVPGARLVPMGQLASRLAEIDKSAPVYLICRSGNRSGAMLDLMLAQGFDAYNVLGGTAAWAAAGRPVERGL